MFVDFHPCMEYVKQVICVPLGSLECPESSKSLLWVFVEAVARC